MDFVCVGRGGGEGKRKTVASREDAKCKTLMLECHVKNKSEMFCYPGANNPAVFVFAKDALSYIQGELEK